MNLQDDVPDKKAVGTKLNGNNTLPVSGGSGGDSSFGNRNRSGSTGEESNGRAMNGNDIAVDFDPQTRIGIGDQERDQSSQTRNY